MQIKILFDKNSSSDRFLAGWGISYLVDDKILFDTGGDPYFLFRNIADLDVDIDNIGAVCISHNHWDHVGGLWSLLRRRKGLDVYICPHFSRKFKDKVKELHGKIIEVEKLTEISKNIFVTGEISGVYMYRKIFEQALIIKTEKGITVVTGCSHPGIVRILTKVKRAFPKEKLYFVLGGFHLKDSGKRQVKNIVERFKEMVVEKVGPSHCSGKDAEEAFKEKYGQNFIPIKVGQILEI